MAPPLLPSGLYAVCDDTVRRELPMREKARLLLEGGVRVMQLRFKVTPSRDAVEAAKWIAAACHERGAVCLVNDRVDVALVAEAGGVHLGDEDLPVADARRVLGPDAIIGATVRDLAGAREAQCEGADYVGVGPLFGTSTKQVNAPVLGLEAFRRLVANSPLPVVGIAGITLANIGEVAAAGARCAAVVSDLLNAADVQARARELQAAFERGRGDA